jgi:hypothetical protein
MENLNFNGFGNTPSSCEYCVGEINGGVAIVFYQNASIGTSITNMIEHLTIHVLANRLTGTPPENVRVFEHYNPELKPIIEWQEVSFGSSGEIDEGKSVIGRLIELVIPSTDSPRYYVDAPIWNPVTRDEIEILSQID